MSGDDYRTYKGITNRSAGLFNSDETVRGQSARERVRRLDDAAARAAREAPRTHAKAVDPNVHTVNHALAQNEITAPPTEAEEVHLVLVDNSGSNRAIADALKYASGYVHGITSSLAGNAAMAYLFFSDHCDGRGIFQEANYTLPGGHGEDVLRASIAQIHGMSGGDEPEAIECALHRAAKYPFGHVPKERRFLYLVTDQVAHNMGYAHGDRGCPEQRSWQRSVEEVHETFEGFQVVASGEDRQVFDLQKKFIAADRRAYDLMDLATGNLTHQERCRLVPNAVLFLIARNRGDQAVQLFLMTLYEKWLANPMYGSSTKPRAQQQIRDFCRYLESPDADKETLLARVFGEV